MKKTITADVIWFFSRLLSPNIPLRKVKYLIIVAKAGAINKLELKNQLRTGKNAVNTYTKYFTKRELVRTRKNEKGWVVELDSAGITLFEKLSKLTGDEFVEMVNCPVCDNRAPKSSHHILPQEHFGDIPIRVDMCFTCHKKLGKLVHDKPEMTPEEYMRITFDFLKNKS